MLSSVLGAQHGGVREIGIRGTAAASKWTACALMSVLTPEHRLGRCRQIIQDSVKLRKHQLHQEEVGKSLERETGRNPYL